MNRLATLAAMLAAAIPGTVADAQRDARLQIVPYVPDTVVTVRVVPGFVTSVVLNPDERIVSVAVGNTAAWEVTPNKAADRLFIKALGPGPSTNVEVVTDSRAYSLMLQSTYDGDPQAAFRVGFDYTAGGAAGGAAASAADAGPAVSPVSVALPVAPTARYAVHGDPLVRPLTVDDDGTHTRFVFAPAAALPAIYALDERGGEVLVTARDVDGALVVDRIWSGYVLRRGTRSARVRRIAPRGRR